MIVFTMKTSRGGRPKNYFDLDQLLKAIKEDIISKVKGMGGSKITIEIKRNED